MPENNEAIENRKIILTGNANVGKSVIFGLLTGKYAVVSNYPGTTVEISRSPITLAGRKYTLVDTPGIANLLPMSYDEVVTRDMLLEKDISFIVQVADAKNISRALQLSLQIAEMGIPFILDLNMSDEARERRIFINTEVLAKTLGIPVVETIAVSRTGIDRLKKTMEKPAVSSFTFKYDEQIEQSVEKIAPMLPEMSISKRSAALMLLADDSTIIPHIRSGIGKESFEEILAEIRRLRSCFNDPVSYVISRERMAVAGKISEKTATKSDVKKGGLAYKLGNLCMDRWWGIPILGVILTIMYFFVGQFAAGTLVDYFENTLMGQYIIPWITPFIKALFPWPLLQEALIGEYGIISVGITYAIAIVMPIVAAFFLFFSLLEDSGYLPRLAIVANRACRYMGLNGKAVLPMILGLGCGTMAALSARILDSKKEQLMVILLISLGIPCSAQLGVIMGMLAGMNSAALFIWLFFIAGSMFLVGWAANRVIPGETSDFILEIPPLRIPSFTNIFIKTIARVEWYLKEAVPLFMLATFCLFLIDKLGILHLIQNLASPVIVNVLGLPIETTQTFIVGFLRRDYGAAGLLTMAQNGHLSHNQLLVSMVTLTLFLPCVAQFMVIIKEKGLKNALYVAGFILFYSLGAGGLLNLILTGMGVKL